MKLSQLPLKCLINFLNLLNAKIGDKYDVYFESRCGKVSLIVEEKEIRIENGE